MEKKNRTQLVLGILLILAAAWLILGRVYPALGNILALKFDWPVWVMLAGALVLVIGLIVGAPGMAIPAFITAGIGGILYYCNLTNHWEAWSYLWTLIPGFVGLGILFAAIIEGRLRQEISGALNTILVSLAMFVIFATFFNAWSIFGPFSAYVPVVLLFVLGIWFIVRGVVRRRPSKRISVSAPSFKQSSGSSSTDSSSGDQKEG